MARVGEVDPKFRELMDATDSLARELERVVGGNKAPYLMQRLTRFVEAMISAKSDPRY